MKKALLFVLLLATCLVNAQTNDTWQEITLTNQPSPLIYITLGKHRYSNMGSQAFTAKIKNLTTNKQKIKGTLIANLTCGNQVTNDFNFTIEPGETVGGGSALMGDDVGLLSVATKEDCQGEQFTPDPSSPNYHVYNRIKSLSIVNLTIQEVKPVKYNNVEVGGSDSKSGNDNNSTSQKNNATNNNVAATAQKQEELKRKMQALQQAEQSRQAQIRQQENYNQKIQDIQHNTQQLNQAVEDGVNAIGAIAKGIMDTQEKQQEEQEQRRIKAESEKRERAARESYQREQNELKRQQEKLKAEQEKVRQQSITQQILGDYDIQQKTSQIAANIKQVYYITYERNYASEKVTVKTYTLNKYSDDTWMAQRDFLKKIGFGIYDNQQGEAKLLGAFTSKKTALAAIAQIESNSNAVINKSFIPANDNSSVQSPTGADKDFWNN